ncbi:hypothetical protein EDD85DRAFT_951624 [Armillaria nabsnona]|nr:hypothetical protein EDD85DRAFT_951624 [Armillaria nabsnona]
MTAPLKQAPWVFGYVCHHWRVFMRSSPSLWASLYVDLASPPVRNLLTTFLSLSTNVPLDITLNVKEIGDEGKEVLYNDIIPLSHRWSNLRIIVTKDTVFEFLAHHGSVTNTQIPPYFRVSGSTPLLRSATILACQPLDIALPLSQITDLCLLNNPIWAFSHLTVATALKSFTFHCSDSAVFDDNSLPQSLIHENLTSCLILPAIVPSIPP